MALQGVVSKVGLQLLLEPQTATVAFRGACGVVGALYPAYETYKLVESKAPMQSAETRKWLKYWIVYGGLSLVESSTDKLLAWFPYYYHAKFAFLMWLQMSQPTGAARTGADFLYHQYLQPVLRRYQPKIDVCLDYLYGVLAAVYAMYRVPIQTGVAVAREGASQAKHFAAWFLQDSPPSSAPPPAVGPRSDSPEGDHVE